VSILDAVGGTPIVRLDALWPDTGVELYAKLEMLNPGGSTKDRPALRMVREALASGRIQPGGLLIESSSGNMALGLAQACQVHGVRLIVVVDEKTPDDTRRLLTVLGATVDCVTAPDPATGQWLIARLARVQALLAEHPGSVWTDQYHNLDNPRSHEDGTAREVMEALGEPDAVLVAVSTCGTVSGFRDYVRAKGLRTRVIAVDVENSALFGRAAGPRPIPGIGSSLQPAFFAPEEVEVRHVSTRATVGGCWLLARREAFVAGGSAGAVVVAARRVANELPKGSRVAMVLVDRGERYLDTVYDPVWVERELGSVSQCIDEAMA
jgi:cysteine synthase A